MLPRCVDGAELLDGPALEPAELARTLRFLDLAHRWFGGERAIRGFLDRWSEGWPSRPVSFLDAGAGGGALALSVVRWARERGRLVRVTALELRDDLAALARGALGPFPEARVVRGDLFFLPPGARYDYALSSLLLHHLPGPRLAEGLKALDAHAARGIVALDLERSRAALAGVTLATALLGDPVTRHDGPLSVRRAYLPEELEGAAREAGLPYLRVRRHAFFRLSLAGEKAHA